MKLFGKLLFIVVFIVIIAVFALSLFALSFDSNHYKAEISKLASEQTGREIQLNDDLTLSIFPNIAIKTGKASIGNAEGFTDKHFANINAADISVKLLPLLQQKLEINTVILHGLDLNLHRNSQGENNWDDLAGNATQTEETTESDVAEVITQMVAGLTVSGISVKDSRIHWQDDTTGQKVELSSLTLNTGAYKADKPLAIQLATQLKQNNPPLNLSVEASTELRLNKEKQTFNLKSLELATRITGDIAKGGAIDSQLTGDISGNAESVRIPNLQLSTSITGDMMPNGKITANLSGNTQFQTKSQQLSISNMVLDSNITGKPLQGGTLNSRVTAKTNVNLKSQVLDLTGMKSDIQLSGGPLADGQLQATLEGNTQLDLQQSSVKINKLNLASTSNSSHIPSGQLEQNATGSLKLNWANNTGQADLTTLAIKLANLHLSGSATIAQLMDAPEINGSFKSNTFELSQLLKTLGITPPITQKAGVLGQTQMNVSLQASTEQLQLSNIAIQMDDSNIAGKLSVQNFASPNIQGKLTIDQLNVDHYMSPEDPNKPANSAATALLPLAAMRNLNMDASLSVASMVYSKIKMNNASIQLNANNGVVKADPISADLYKGKYTGNIHLNTAKATPSISMQHKLRGLRSEGILADLFDDKLVTGAADFTANIQTTGNSIADIKQNLLGNIDVVFRDGTIRDSNFAKKMEIAVQAFEKKETDASGKSEVKFTKLSGDWTAKNGIFTTDNMAMKAPRFEITGTGDVNIVKEDLDFQLNIGRKKQAEQRNIFIPLRIYGAFSDIKYQLKLGDLLKQLAQEDIDKEKQRLKEKLKAEEDRLAEKLKAERDAEKQKLQDKANREKERLESQLEEQAQQAKEKLQAETERLKEKLGDELGEQLEDKLKDKLKGLF